jgi:signal transduction histidine kinase
VPVAFATLSSLVVVTNPVHGLVWADFAIDPAFGAATADYAHHAWVFVQYGGVAVMTTVGVYLLLDTVVAYGPLYRTQAAAVALTPVPPALAFTVWVFGLGPASQLNLTAMMFLPHMVLDVYALFGGDMFEFSPSTRRAGERAALDDLGNPVVIVDDRERVVTLNDAAESAFGVGAEAALTRDLASVVGADVDLDGDAGTVTVVADGRRRVFKPVVSPLSDDAGAHVGYTVVLQDVTAERRRGQRLAVLNRVLRHNLRNDLNVVLGNVEIAAERTDDDAIRPLLRAAEDEAASLMALGNKARDVERVVGSEGTTEPVAARAALAPVVDDLGREFPDGGVEVAVPADLTLRTDPRRLEAVVGNLVENALEHGGDEPTVRVELAGTDPGAGTATLAVVDDGPGIPDHELVVLDDGDETALEHGSGLGLWVVVWGVRSLGGEVAFEDAPGGGTRALVTLPGYGGEGDADADADADTAAAGDRPEADTD